MTQTRWSLKGNYTLVVVRVPAPLTQNSRLSAYSRQRRHLTASSRAIPTGAPPRAAHLSPGHHGNMLAARTQHGALRNCACSVRETRIPSPRALARSVTSSRWSSLRTLRTGQRCPYTSRLSPDTRIHTRTHSSVSLLRNNPNRPLLCSSAPPAAPSSLIKAAAAPPPLSQRPGGGQRNVSASSRTTVGSAGRDWEDEAAGNTHSAWSVCLHSSGHKLFAVALFVPKLCGNLL